MKKVILVLSVLFICFFMFTPSCDAGLISKEQEIEMGRKTAIELEQKYGLYPDRAMQERVNRLGQELVKYCGRQDLEYSFKVLNDDSINALAAPGGFIYVFKGLVDYMPSDAELAGVLAHEVSHVVKKHTIGQMEKSLLTNIALIAITGGRNIQAASVASQMLTSGYSRTDERGADKEGLRNMIAADLNPYGMLVTTSKLEDLAAEKGNPGYGLFASHPEPEERLKRIQKQLAPLKIKPDVIVNENGTATVKEGDWTFNMTEEVANTKAKYRAYLLAGGLYAVRERGLIQPNRFIVQNHGNRATIYYDDIEVINLYPQDAKGFGSLGSYANACTGLLRNWANMVNAAKTYKAAA